MRIVVNEGQHEFVINFDISSSYNLNKTLAGFGFPEEKKIIPALIENEHRWESNSVYRMSDITILLFIRSPDTLFAI
jgi:hypothetical protein